jgi:choline kinase
MGAATAARPKCLNEVDGRPLIEWQQAALRKAGIQDIAIVRGYLAEMLAFPDCALFENPRWAQTNMVSTLRCAEEWLSAGPCLVSYADILYHEDHVRRLANAPGDIAITYDRLWLPLWQARFPDPLADAETFRCHPDGSLCEIGRRAAGLEEIQGQYMGLLKLTAAGWTRIRALLDSLTPAEQDRLDMTSLLSRLLAGGLRVETVPVEGRWCEVDSDTDRLLYEEKIRQPGPWRHDWRSASAA